jgi:hypothetical protein
MYVCLVDELSLFLSNHFTFVYHGSLLPGCILDLFLAIFFSFLSPSNINIIVIIKNAQARGLPGVVGLINTKCWEDSSHLCNSV